MILESDSPQATHEIGRRLGRALGPGHVVALTGPLGSGKTTLVRGIADGAGVADLRQVSSPTFIIVNEYETIGSLRIYHVDTYRLGGSDDLEVLGFDEMTRVGAVLVEWADRVADLLPADRLSIQLEPLAADRRRLHCRAEGAGTRILLEALGPRA